MTVFVCLLMSLFLNLCYRFDYETVRLQIINYKHLNFKVMSKVKPGSVGIMTGKTGDVIVQNWRDLLVGRSARTEWTVPPTNKQLDQQAKFGLVSSFFGVMTTAVKKGYKSKSKIRGNNAAVKDHLETAIIGTYPDYQLDYAQVKVTKSNNGFTGGFIVKSNPLPDAKVSLSWNVLDRLDFIPELGTPKDFVNVAFYSVKRHKGIFYFGEAERSARTAIFDLPYSFEGDELHAYLFFTSRDGKYVSDSDYAGSFILQE